MYVHVSKNQSIYMYVHVCSFYMLYPNKFQAALCYSFLGLRPPPFRLKTIQAAPLFSPTAPPPPIINYLSSTSESTESVPFAVEWESFQREVVTDSPGGVDFPSWRLTLHGHLSDDWPTTLSMRTASWRIANLLFVVYSKSFWSWRTKILMHSVNFYQYPVWGQQQLTHVSIGKLFFISTGLNDK